MSDKPKYLGDWAVTPTTSPSPSAPVTCPTCGGHIVEDHCPDPCHHPAPSDPEVEALVDALITAAYQNGIAETGGMAGALTIDGTRYETDAARTALLSAIASREEAAREEGRREGAEEGLSLRPEVLAFARAMEAELRENEHKGGWRDCGTDWLLRRMGDERRELTAAVARWRTRSRCYCGDPKHEEDRAATARAVLSEATDVANFAMMVADVCGSLAIRDRATQDKEEGR